MFGWLSDMFSKEENVKPLQDRDKEILVRLSRAQEEIDRSKRLLRASGYYNDRLEGTRNYVGRNS